MKNITSSIEWHENLNLGLSEIDSTHRRLFELAHELASTEPGEAEQVFDDLRRYALYHYQHEEELMQKHHIDAECQRAHLAFHSHYISYIDQMGSMIHEGLTAELDRVLIFLLKWLKWHITAMDVLLAQKIREPNSEEARQKMNVLKARGLSDVYYELGQKILEFSELSRRLEDEISRRKVIELDFALSNARLHAMVNFSHSWEYWEEPNGQIIYTSPSCERITGYTAAEFIENPDLIYDIIHPEDYHIMEQHRQDKETHEDGEHELPYRIIRRDGTINRVGHSCHAVYGSAGRFLGRRGSIRDRNERHEQDEQQRLAETVFTSVNEAVIVMDQNHRILRVNPSFTHITGMEFKEVQCLDGTSLFDDGDEPGRVMNIANLVEETGFWQGEILGRHKDGHVFDSWISIYCVENKDGQPMNYVLVFSDISERKKNEDRIYRLAHFDLLTGLPNRALLLDRLQQGLLKARREASLLALMFVDLDKFKLVNDTLGHYIGDLLLKEVAKRLEECIRESDTAARIGGDEFIVLLPSIQSEVDARGVGEKILKRVKEDCILDGNRVNIGVSIGIAIFPMHGNAHEELMTNADAAMYQAKHGGGPSVVSFGELER
ncbi:diguanylate cyclase [Oxalobacter sp. OttesenSCG-928-P03]|nr:diguanylate cyclase [Oxalobacter sp. OttesenSCG-928-P03]